MREIDRIINWPSLNNENFRITSPESLKYNCVAWSVHHVNKKWWPTQDYYWPSGFPLKDSMQNFIDTFISLGYTLCNDAVHEDGYEKVAIFSDVDGMPTHIARQLESGKWTSKLGDLEDIEHDTLHSLEGPSYGTISQIMKKPIVT